MTSAGWALVVLHANVALYAAAFMAQSPVQPELMKQLSAERSDVADNFARFKSFFALLQVAGSLFAGKLIDRLGARAVILVSFVASACVYGLTSQVTSMAMLFAAQLPTLLQHAVMAARAYISLAVPPGGTARAQQLGLVSLSYGCGTVAGPLLGGWLGEYSIYWTAGAAAVLSLASAAFVVAFLPVPEAVRASWHRDGSAAGESPSEVHRPEKNAVTAVGGGKSSGMGYLALLALPSVPSLLLVKAVGSLAGAVFHSSLAIAAAPVFGMRPSQVGAFTSWAGGLMMLSSGLLVKPAAALGSFRAVSVACSLALALSFVGYAASAEQWHLFALSLPQIPAATIATTLSMTALADAVPDSAKGAVAAADMALGSATRILSPLLCNWLFSAYGFPALGWAACALSLLTAGLMGAGIGVGAARGRSGGTGCGTAMGKSVAGVAASAGSPASASAASSESGRCGGSAAAVEGTDAEKKSA